MAFVIGRQTIVEKSSSTTGRIKGSSMRESRSVNAVQNAILETHTGRHDIGDGGARIESRNALGEWSVPILLLLLSTRGLKKIYHPLVIYLLSRTAATEIRS